jgi:hypothetical protein
MTYAPLRRRDHVELAQSRALESLKKPLLQVLLASRVSQLQKIEDALWEVISLRNLDDGFGVILDALGGLVGRGRSNENDAAYKISIQIQIIQNNASGVVADYEAIAALLEPASLWTIDDIGAGGFVLYTAGDPSSNPARAYREFEAIRVLGTGMVLLVSVGTPGEELRWGWSGDALVGVPGLGWSGDDTVGGRAGYAYP